MHSQDDAAPGRRTLLLAGSAWAALSSIGCAPSRASAAGPKVPGPPAPTGGPHDFEFFAGRWQTANRRLKQRWVKSDEWETFPSSLVCANHMGGIVQVEEVDFPTKGWLGMTVRAFDLETKQWSLYWINSRTGKLFPPVIGGFDGDRGVFYGDDTDEGRPVKVQFTWTRLGPDAARWQQAFSLDGQTWETNWYSDHTRIKG
jgi:hypothetical protein